MRSPHALSSPTALRNDTESTDFRFASSFAAHAAVDALIAKFDGLAIDWHHCDLTTIQNFAQTEAVVEAVEKLGGMRVDGEPYRRTG